MFKAWLYAVTICLTQSGLAAAAARLDVQGHRGARAARPENTWPAFAFALDAGVDTLEMDTLITADDHVIVTHDPTLNPQLCLDARGRPIRDGLAVRALTLKELQTYDCGTLKNPRFRAQTPVPKTRIPTLAEIFARVKAHPRGGTIRFNIETKIDPAHADWAPEPEQFVALLFAEIKKAGVGGRVTLQSFDPRTLDAGYRLDDKIPRALLLETRPITPLAELARAHHAIVLSPNHEWLTAADVTACHNAGLRVLPWTPNRPEDWQRLIAAGVDGLITDAPHELLKYLNR